MSPEHCAVRLLCDGSAPDTPEAWAALVALAARRGLAPVLLAHPPAVPPPDTLAELRRLSMLATARHLRVRSQLAEVLAAARAAGVEVVLLKGACLAHTAYAHPAQRTHGDLDLLVRRADLAAVTTVCDQLGYGTAASSERDGHHLPARVRADALPIEWHWRPLACRYAPGLDQAELDALWRRTQPTVVDGLAARLLAPEDMLLALSAHWALSNRCDGGPRALLDVALACRHWADALDWPALWARAARWRMQHGLALTLATAAELLSAPVPDAGCLEVPDELRERVRLRVTGGAVMAPSGRVADAASHGPFGLLALALRRALTPPAGVGRPRWRRHWADMRARHRCLRCQGDELAAERRLAAWLAER